MAWVVNTNTSTTACSTTLARAFPAAANYAYVTQKPGETVRICTTTDPIAPNTVRLGSSKIMDVYKGTAAESLYNPISPRNGASALFQVNEVWTVTDDTVAYGPVYLPVSVHVVLRAPNHPAVDAAAIKGILGRLMGAGQKEAGTDMGDAMIRVLRGAVIL